MKLLYVDDKKTWHKLIEIVLSLRGVNVLHAYTPKEALNIAAAEKPDLALIDVSISGGSAYDLIPEILRRGVPVVVIGHKAEGFDREKALSLGAYEALEKPFTVEELLDLLRKARKEASKPEEKLELVLPSESEEFETVSLGLEPEESVAEISEEEVPVIPVEKELRESIPVIPVEVEESGEREKSPVTVEETVEEKKEKGESEKEIVKRAEEEVKQKVEKVSGVTVPEEKVEEIIREIAWEVIPEIAEKVIREEVEKLIRSRLA